MENRIIIIDGNSLINRAYYAMQRPMITKDGIYTQGIYGFINMLNKIIKDYESEYIVVTFDLKAPTFRHKEYSEYKAGRKKMPPELVMQLPLLKDILKASNIKILEMEGFEADDLIGTISKEAEEQGIEPLIITGDKDALQLASSLTKILITKKGISEFEIYDHDFFVEQYGFEPIEFIDYKGLMGDSSDNIPGVPGVGKVTAGKLITKYKTIENILENVEELKPAGLKKKIEENVQLALMSKRLATINRFVPFELNFDEYKFQEPNIDKLVEIYKKLEFNTFLKRINTKNTKKIEIKPYSHSIIDSISDIDNLGNIINDSKEVGVKIFGDGNHREESYLEGIAVCIDKKIYYVNGERKDLLAKLVEILKKRKPKYYGHDLKNDYFMLMSRNVEEFETAYDTAIAEYVIDSSRSSYELNLLFEDYFDCSIELSVGTSKEEEQLVLFKDTSSENCKVSGILFYLIDEIRIAQEEQINRENLNRVLNDVELPLVEVMAYLEYVGFGVSKDVLESQGIEIQKLIDDLTEKIYSLAGEEFNIKSPAQLGIILFEKLELEGAKKTKRGYSTDASVLEKIKDKHEIIPLILEYRTVTKLMGTYIDGLIPLISEDERIHAKFNQTVTTTGRISSSEPNLQNIPIRNELGRMIRKAFVPSANCTLIGADYSQIELRVLAHMSGDELLISAFNEGLDIHRATAARVLKVPENEITDLQRSRAKAVNFGVIYGMSAFGLSEELSISRKEADNYIKDYFEQHQAVKSFMDWQVEFCKKNGYVTTIVGRKRYIKEISASNYMVKQAGERLAMNTPIQGSAADIIKLAMIKVYENLKPYKSKLVLQVHDELVIEAAQDEIEIIKDILRESMENAMKLKVSIDVSLNEGANWYLLK